MNEEPTGRLDLNLLAIFDAIMIERSLTSAGKRLGITQSAVSHALARLREITGDALFERTGRGVRPTPAALAMGDNVRSALDLLRLTLRSPHGSFSPQTDSRTFVLDIPAGIDALIVPALHAMMKAGDSIRFRISQGRASFLLHELRYGESWIALDHEQPTAPGYRVEKIMDDPYVLIARVGHPAICDNISPEVFCSLSHISVTWSRHQGPTPLSKRLDELGIVRDIKYAVPSITTLPALVESSDLVGAVPKRIAGRLARNFAVELHALDWLLPPMSVYMVWHESFETDPGHIWLRNLMREVCQSL
ncbi:MAG: LysR family transcriptional regulator [Hyphomicrobiaceae bacterium]|nr:LysR family transcriptional regulator [Hyphomicrobiaceae bacterium]